MFNLGRDSVKTSSEVCLESWYCIFLELDRTLEVRAHLGNVVWETETRERGHIATSKTKFYLIVFLTGQK